ncbi:MAG: Endoglucanase [Candidatus Nomurabacteria bacterium GW2011_GWB1_37_5]|uniref:Endoglucanase n=1 Tax=Candidatus Nomurabacteria bacterium GW2011_GWB1_37_5 TaxID=1618742 RepID=A0A0G0JG68_9BACT|nr:MAG: Endoglucanase [Candidatus Nomurabacteria bacterium GW2011_GWB1_37_5]
MLHKLKTEGNKIVNELGEEVILKGININSPCILKYQENHDFLNDIREIKKLGTNAVRIPICPAYWQSVENYCEEILNPIVQLSKELDLYCCLDWHAQGNPFKNETREPNQLIEGYMKYDAKKELAFEVLEKISKLYGKENHIIFDVFGMPIDIENKDWINITQKFVDVVRKNTENIIVVNGTNWSSDLSWVFIDPIKSKNIVYGICYYPLEKTQDISVVIKVKEIYPIIFSECGYTIDGYFKGTKEDYAAKLKKYVSEYGFGFFAWCYHPKRVPVILNSWDPNDLTEWGRFLKEELLK